MTLGFEPVLVEERWKTAPMNHPLTPGLGEAAQEFMGADAAMEIGNVTEKAGG